jgi:hypothetical protein
MSLQEQIQEQTQQTTLESTPDAEAAKILFETLIKEWVGLDDKISEINKNARTLKNKKEQLGDDILLLMKKNDIPCINISNGKLRVSESKTKSAIKQDNVEQVLTEHLKNSSTAKELADVIFVSKRDFVVKEYLKRTNNRKKKEKT